MPIYQYGVGKKQEPIKDKWLPQAGHYNEN